MCKKQRMLVFLAVFAAVVAFMLATAIKAEANADPVDDFVIPQPIANPQTPDQEFFNMRLQFFLPETEPLIKETFGSALRFEQGAFWEYPSYYSRAVGFATNLPSLAKIEYGPTTNYGFSTAQTDFYYYQHLCHLKGLQPGTTYHYRIKVKGSDGQFICSPDYTFTTLTLPQDIIRIPQDLQDKSLPYKLSGDNKKYLLTQDIIAPNGGIVLGGNNVVLDLGGHTITYDLEPNLIVSTYTTKNWSDLAYNELATYGIRCALWYYQDQKVFNGTIIQGANGGSGIIGVGSNPLYFSGSDRLEVGGVTAEYFGDSINGIFGGQNNNIHHNVVYDRGSVIDDRHMQIRAITAGGQNEAAYNSVRRCRQCGITMGNLQHDNEIYGDSFTVNSFLLEYATNSISTNNKIFGLGYSPIGIGSGGMHDAVARNNFIYLHAYAPNQRFDEYDRLSGAAGFRPQIYDGNTARCDNNLFENNVVICKAWKDSVYVRALWVCADEYSRNTVIRNNIVKVEGMEEGIVYDDFNYCFACVDLQGSEVWRETPEVLFADNRFITNMNYITIGTGYGMGKNASFYRNTFEKINHHAGYYIPFRLGFWYWSTANNKLIDSLAGPGVDLSLPPIYNTNNIEAHLALDIGISSQRAYVDAASGAPLTNRNIAYRLDGGEQGAFVTDAAGTVYREWITTKNEHKPGEALVFGGPLPQVHNKTVTFTVEGYEPLTVNIADIQGTGAPIRFGAGQGSVTYTGKVLYQTSTRPAIITLYGSGPLPICETKTTIEGEYELTIPAASVGTTYKLVITKLGYLSYTINNLTLIEGKAIDEVDIRQLAGDVNGDGIVNAVDLTCLLSEFNRPPLLHLNADIDGNGIVNAADLTYLLAGFNKRDVEIRN
jgi:hypothetical protein